MQRVDTLIKKLQEQFAANVPISQMVTTVQMLQAQLAHIQSLQPQQEKSSVAVDIPQTILQPLLPVEEEKTVEVLQINDEEIEAELEEIKRNAEAITKISLQNKPQIIFEEPEQEIPTLAAQHQKETTILKKEINETIANNNSSSVHDNLKQTEIDLGSSLFENNIKDLKKAIGINDRFLFINDLFRGDEMMYERSIKTINSFSILPEAEYWIQRELKTKLGWNEANETVKQFIQLIKRRFL